LVTSESSTSEGDAEGSADSPQGRSLPPVLSRLARGTFWLALRTPLQVVIAFVSIPLVQRYVGYDKNGAYVFAWGFGFLQFLLEFGMSSALQRQVSDCWTRHDRDGVDRAVTCGLNFYATMALIQAAVLLLIAYVALPRMTFDDASRRLIVQLLWLQALTAPCFGLTVVVSSVLQAARRYDVLPRFELLIVIVRFCVLAVGYWLDLDFFYVVVSQTVAQVALSLGPAVWVMVRELDYIPKLGGVRLSDYKSLLHISFYMFLIQLSVVLADKIDTTILGFAIADEHLGGAITVYQNVSKPFLQIRQTGWTLTYLVMPAVASLLAAGDLEGLERVKYDGPRFLIGLLAPITLLVAIYAGPFLNVWVGPRFEPEAPLLRLFLIGVIPLVISVHVQMAIAKGKIEVIALAALVGSLVNLPLSYYLTLRIGVAGVIWGTVVTTLFSNLLVPALFVFRELEIHPATYLQRTLSAPVCGMVALVVACGLLNLVWSARPPEGASRLGRYIPFLTHLSVGVLAYLAGYMVAPRGRDDLAALGRRLSGRLGLKKAEGAGLAG
jgi:O-antigen/teichoic acid export membrane protein